MEPSDKRRSLGPAPYPQLDGRRAQIQVFSKATDAIQQGAFRRGANMGIMRIDHPDIYTFITFKDDRTRLTNYNISVAVTDKFLECLKDDPTTVHAVQNPRSGEWSSLCKEGMEGECWTVGELWDMIIDHAHSSGEPGIVFIDRINQTNPIKNVGVIEATNPCGEQPLHAWDSCNLGSINLSRFVVELDGTPTIDYDHLRDVVRIATRFLDNVIDANAYSVDKIEEMTRSTRKIGLGVMGFADMLARLRIPYDSEEGLELGRKLMRFVMDESDAMSEELAEERGVFPAFEGSLYDAPGRPKMRNEE
mgnify:CR=1 FL=1